jgi:hypothetical protein
MRHALWLALVALTACARAPDLPLDPQDARRCPNAGAVTYDCARFSATHNSYSAQPLAALLDGGVRFVELDVHDEDFRAAGDFRVGHALPGWELRRGGGNPDGDRLGDWLDVVAAWSAAHPGHAPITIGIDVKDALDGVGSREDGDADALNQRLVRAFGPRLFTAEDLDAAGTWPGVDALRGRVVVVLSGDRDTRLAYRRQAARSPAVAVDAAGRVVAVHEDDHGALWAWTGRSVDGRIRWLRRTRYDRGREPAVALGPDGALVEVHRSAGDDGLWSHVGRIGEDGAIAWSGAPVRYDEGAEPTVRFEDGRLVALHRDADSDGNRVVRGDLADGAVAWDAPARTWRPRHDKAADHAGARSVRVFTAPDAAMPADTLRCATERVPDARVRFEQVAFVELQPGDPAALRDDGLRFAAAPAGDRDFAAEQLAAGRVVRLWGFDDPAQTAGPTVQLPATDHPFAHWYRAFADRIRASR